MKIVLMGYMASGKSFLGNKLSEILNFEFVDLDNYIQEKEDLTISNIFSEKGEIYFRKAEHKYLNDLLKRDQNFILSLGGGTPCYGNNLETLLNQEDVVLIYLKASIKTLAERLTSEKSKRPLISHIKDDDELTEFIGKHLFERSYYYSQAKIHINVDGDLKDIIDNVIFKLF